MNLITVLKQWLRGLVQAELEPEIKDLGRSWERINEVSEELRRRLVEGDAMRVAAGLMKEVGDVKHANLSLSAEMNWLKKDVLPLVEEVKELRQELGKLREERQEMQVQLDALRSTKLRKFLK